MTRVRFKMHRIWVAAVLAVLTGVPVMPAMAERDEDSFRSGVQRNPFALPRGVYYKVPQTGPRTAPVKKETPKPPELPPLSLEAVVWGGPEAVAVINGGNYVVGDAVSGHELLDIGRDHVVLMGRKKTVTLRLDASPLHAEISR